MWPLHFLCFGINCSRSLICSSDSVLPTRSGLGRSVLASHCASVEWAQNRVRSFFHSSQQTMRQVFREWKMTLGALPRTGISTHKEYATFDAVILLLWFTLKCSRFYLLTLWKHYLLNFKNCLNLGGALSHLWLIRSFLPTKSPKCFSLGSL